MTGSRPHAAPLNILLVAEEGAGNRVLRGLLDGDHRVAAVMTSADGTGGVAGAAAEAGIPVWDARLVTDPRCGEMVRDARVDVVLNVHSLYIIHPSVLAAPAIGSFNLHPGPLPGYAGLNAPSWAVYNGEERHAVTLHWMAAGIDTGPVAYETSFPVGARDTALTVSTNCVRHGVPLVARLLAAAAADPGSIPAVAQDLSARRCFGRHVPNGGRVVWTDTARRLVDFVRACDYLPFASPWGSPVATLDGREMEILKASATDMPVSAAPGTTMPGAEGELLVAASDLWVRIERMRPVATGGSDGAEAPPLDSRAAA
jgi:UDP-4-amino-4-deoxy-L-arabinose formyltransferase/UDP-glucuronic acid dehydrogenase (UDP-4-keto-hexauronic acid decarboxylating)